MTLPPAILESCLALPVANADGRRPAFQVRLVFDVPLDEGWLEDPVGWRPATNEGYYRWFSKTRRSALRVWTEEILGWTNGARGLPTVLLSDMSQLRGARVQGQDGLPDVRLHSIDLVPFRGAGLDEMPRKIGFGRRDMRPRPTSGALGLVFRGKACTVADYLRWTSSRAKMSKLRLASPRLERLGATMNIAGLVGELQLALSEGRRPDLRKMNARRGGLEFQLCQAVHLPRDVFGYDDSITEDQAQLVSATASLIASASRPRKGYPKDPDSTKMWMHPRSPQTIYALDDAGATFLIGASEDGFNQTTKPVVALEPHYLQWLLAQHVDTVSPAPQLLLSRSFTEAVRRTYMMRCLEFFGAIPEEEGEAAAEQEAAQKDNGKRS